MDENPKEPDLVSHARQVLERLKSADLTVATAESCTGGMLASLLTDVEGYGEYFDRAFVAYTNEAKSEMLGVDQIAIRTFGAVSKAIVNQMAKGALRRSCADLIVAITGFAGPAGPQDEEGLVFLEVHSRTGKVIARKCRFGTAGRDPIRALAADRALEMLLELMDRLDPLVARRRGSLS